MFLGQFLRPIEVFLVDRFLFYFYLFLPDFFYVNQDRKKSIPYQLLKQGILEQGCGKNAATRITGKEPRE